MTSVKDSKWERSDTSRRLPISDQDKQLMADYFQARLKMGEPRDDLLEELAAKYQRSTRQIERYIAGFSRRKETSQEQQTNENEKLVALIQKWREDVASYSPVQLLLGRLDEASNDALSRFFTNKDTEMLYLEARLPHETLDVKRLPLQVESDPLFGLLQQKFPTSKVWTALQAWGEQVLPYLRAFRHLLNDLESAVHSAFDLLQVDNGTFPVFIERCRFERSYAVLLACDLLARRLAALSSNIRWALLGIDLEKLRLRVNLELSSLTRHPRKGGWLDGIKDICALDPFEQASAFLNELVKLQAAEDLLTAALQELESRI